MHTNDIDKYLELWLIRHGESIGNIEEYVTGSAVDALTDLGKEQASILGKYIKNNFDKDKDILISSSMIRAIDTAKHLGLDTDPLIYDGLNEQDGGSVSYWKRTKFDLEYHDFWTAFDPRRKFPDGESHMDLYDRINSCIDEILETTNKRRIFLVAHSGTISSIMHRSFNVPMEFYSRFKSDHCSVSIIKLENSTLSFPSLIQFNKCYGEEA